MIEDIKKQRLIEKIRNNNFDFTREEIYLLNKNFDILQFFITILNKIYDDAFLNNRDTSYYDNVIDILMNIDDIDYISLLSTNVMVKLVQKGIDTNFYTYLEIEDMLSEGNFNEKQKQIIRDYYQNALRTNNYNNLYLSSNGIEVLLNFKRYDLLKNATISEQSLSFDLKKRLITEFRNNNIKTSNIDLVEDEFDILSFYSLVKLILDRINNNQSYDELMPFFDKELNNIDNYEIDLFQDYNLLISKLPDNYKDKIINKLKNDIKNGGKLIYIYTWYNYDIFDNIVEELIEYGHLNLALYSNSFSNYIDRIIQLIEEKSPYYQNLGAINLKDYNEYPELVECFIKNNKKIILSSDDTVEYTNSIIFKLLQAGHTNFEFSGAFFPDDELLLKTLKEKNYYLLNKIDWNDINYSNLGDNFLNLLQICLKDNLEFLDKFINSIIGDENIILNFLNQKKFLDIIFNISTSVNNQILDFLSSETERLNKINQESFEMIFNMCLNHTSLNKQHLIELKNRFGYKIIFYLENKNICDLINLDDIEFQKIINLFTNEEYKLTDLEATYDYLKQYEFGKKYPEKQNISVNILTAIENNNFEDLNLLLLELQKIMDENFYKFFYSKHDKFFNMNFKTSKELLDFIIDKIKNGTFDEQKDYREDVLRDITTYYLDRMSGLYRSTYDMYNDLGISYQFDDKNLLNELVQFLIINNLGNFNYNGNVTTFKNALIEEMALNGIEEELAQEIINYYVTHQTNNLKYDEKIVKSNIKNMVKCANNISKFLTLEQKASIIQILDDQNRLRRIYKFSNLEKDVYQILSELKIDVIKNNLLTQDEIYNSLLSLLKKYKLDIMPECIFNYLESNQNLNIKYNYQDLAYFITYYYDVYDFHKKQNESKKDMSDFSLDFIKILTHASFYGDFSIETFILSREDYRLIKSNPEPNVAKTKTIDQRVSESVQRTFENFQRNQVAIPTFNEIVKLNGEKSIRVVVGNFTHPSNLTHGERTRSCMRAGGVGESLYNFCLDNPYGFHIRFEDPQTGEYISRVSGFRNGNTVYLNQLRDSCNANLYLNKDIVDACKIVADMLIEKSKNSSSPIDNVVITKSFAMEETDYQYQNIGVKNIKEGFGYFYSDIGSDCIILATNAKEGNFTPVNFDNSKVEMYLPVRETIKEITDSKQICETINRINIIKQYFENGNYELTELIINNNLIYCICNQDWYIYVDNDLNVYEDLISIDQRAIVEYNQARIKVEEFIKNKNNEREGDYACRLK